MMSTATQLVVDSGIPGVRTEFRNRPCPRNRLEAASGRGVFAESLGATRRSVHDASRSGWLADASNPEHETVAWF